MVIAWATPSNPIATYGEYGTDRDQLVNKVVGARKALITLGRTEYFHEVSFYSPMRTLLIHSCQLLGDSYQFDPSDPLLL